MAKVQTGMAGGAGAAASGAGGDKGLKTATPYQRAEPAAAVAVTRAAPEPAWDGKPLRDAGGALTMQPADVALTVPMLRMTGPAGQEMYMQFRLDVRLSADERRALRELFDALQATGVIVKSAASQGDAIKWLLRQLAMARAAKA